MKWYALPILIAGFLLAADDAKDAAKADQDNLQGTWKMDSIEIGGQEVPEDVLKEFQLSIQGDKYTVKRGDDTIVVATFKLHPTKKPKAIDFTPTEGDNKGKTFHGIYALERDTLKLCRHQQPEEKRPTEFKVDGEMLLVVWKKDKP